MFDTLQSICLGAAAVCDTVLLLALVERRNWPFVRLPMVTMMAGAWLWHAGAFALLLLFGLPYAWVWYLHSSVMLAMVAGVILMSCGLVHGTWRVWKDRFDVLQRPYYPHALCYVPLGLLIPLGRWFFAPQRDDFAAIAAAMVVPYWICAGVVKVLAASVFLYKRRELSMPWAGPFFLALALVLLAMTALQGLVIFVLIPWWPETRPYAMLLVMLLPLAPAFLFAYFVIRFHFLQIILERSLVYGGILGSILLLHQLAFQDVSAAVPESYRLHVVFLETIALTALVILYQPARQRCAEALRYLLGQRVADIRQRLRHMSGELSAHAGQAPAEILPWFVDNLRAALRVDYVASWLIDDAGAISARYGATSRWDDDRVRWLFQRMMQAELPLCARRRSAERDIVHCLQKMGASLALVKNREHVAGLLVIGRGPRNRDLGEEETNAVSLLVEQLAITLDNSVLQAQRLQAERRAMQSEKLSALGLLASSIAHEVKNPLSAIKTIATVLAEDLGPDSPHAEDVRLILGEVERLAGTTSQLLEVARPRSQPHAPASLAQVLHGTLRLLRHLASQQNIVIETNVAEALPPVQADDQSLREIFFNLLSNSLEAAGPGGRVSVACQRVNGFVVTEVRDSGPGLAQEIRDRLFEPFHTTKQGGTGLGLYVVGRRVGELGGSITCASGPTQGTSFTVKLPVQSS